jgi:hypothetical protein
MKAKILSTVATVMVLSVLFLSGQATQAYAQPGAFPVLSIDNLFAALNESDVDSALLTFAPGALAESRPRQQAYLNLDEIASMLEGWQGDGREYQVLQHEITNIGAGLDMVWSEVEISDRGVAWGREEILTVVYSGQIQRLLVTGMRLTPFQYW